MVATITSGSSLALFKNSVSYEIGAQLLNSAATDLHVITVPTGGLLIDLLIKHQKISHIETQKPLEIKYGDRSTIFGLIP